MWTKIKSALAWIGAGLVAILGAAAAIFLVKNRKLASSSEEVAQALDEIKGQEEEKQAAIAAQAEAQKQAVEENHAQAKDNIEKEVAAAANALADDPSGLAAALRKSARGDKS